MRRVGTNPAVRFDHKKQCLGFYYRASDVLNWKKLPGKLLLKSQLCLQRLLVIDKRSLQQSNKITRKSGLFLGTSSNSLALNLICIYRCFWGPIRFTSPSFILVASFLVGYNRVLRDVLVQLLQVQEHE